VRDLLDALLDFIGPTDDERAQGFTSYLLQGIYLFI